MKLKLIAKFKLLTNDTFWKFFFLLSCCMSEETNIYDFLL